MSSKYTCFNSKRLVHFSIFQILLNMPSQLIVIFISLRFKISCFTITVTNGPIIGDYLLSDHGLLLRNLNFMARSTSTNGLEGPKPSVPM